MLYTCLNGLVKYSMLDQLLSAHMIFSKMWFSLGTKTMLYVPFTHLVYNI